jgi:hypothetical protein
MNVLFLFELSFGIDVTLSNMAEHVTSLNKKFMSPFVFAPPRRLELAIQANFEHHTRVRRRAHNQPTASEPLPCPNALTLRRQIIICQIAHGPPPLFHTTRAIGAEVSGDKTKIHTTLRDP